MTQVGECLCGWPSWAMHRGRPYRGRETAGDSAWSKENLMSRRVYIDEDECIGCGSCEEICPEVFRLNGEIDKAEVIKPEGGPEALIQEAMETCPVSCIHWGE